MSAHTLSRNILRFCLTGCFILSINSLVLANTFFVPSQYAQIQDAINAAQAGDTVFVEAGTYDIISAIQMKEKVNLTGAGNQVTILNSLDLSQPAIRGASHSMLSGFTVKKECPLGSPPNGTGIFLENVRQMVIKDNIVTGNMGQGICLKNSHYNVLENNIIKASGVNKSIGDAINLWSSSYNYILDNSVTGYMSGIYAYYGVGNKIEHNFARQIPGAYGYAGGGAITLFVAREAQLLHNTCISLELNGTPGAGITLQEPLNVQINNCLVYGKKQGLYINGGASTTATIKYSDIKGDEQDVMQGGAVNLVYGNGVLFLPPKVSLATGALFETSPCRNSGDSGTPQDPDGSRADMGAFYYELPSNPPLPASTLKGGYGK